MAHDAPYYRDLAERAHADAEKATLDNVRERALRSAAAFETMAVQIERVAKQRAEREEQTLTRVRMAAMSEPAGAEQPL